MKILALEVDNPKAKDEDFWAHLNDEAERVWELQQQEIIREIYFRRDRHEAVLVLECHDEKEAQDMLNTLPLVAAGLISFELVPLKPYSGFARLFSSYLSFAQRNGNMLMGK